MTSVESLSIASMWIWSIEVITRIGAKVKAETRVRVEVKAKGYSRINWGIALA